MVDQHFVSTAFLANSSMTQFECEHVEMSSICKFIECKSLDTSFDAVDVVTKELVYQRKWKFDECAAKHLLVCVERCK